MRVKKNALIFTKSSGNVFKDLGFANAEEMLAKAKLAASINEILQNKGLTQQKAAALLGISQPNVSLLSRGILEDFSLERLVRFLNRLNQNVDIVVHMKICNEKDSRECGHLRVMHA